MKLMRIGQPGQEKPAILDDDGRRLDASSLVADWGGSNLEPTKLAELGQAVLAGLPVLPNTERIGPCVAGPGKFIGIGLNYSDHAAESGLPVPTEPILFMKATSCICGPNDDVIIPRGSVKTDWEVELAVVIGRAAQYVPVAEALNHVAGYCVANDLSERSFQMERGGQWVKGKSADTFGPIGPWLVTTDEVPDPQNLKLWLNVNGTARQNGNTATMIFGVAELVSYVSQFMSLHPGDVISTGTPPGVGMGQNPQVYLSPGDVVELGVEGLGVQRQRLVSADQAPGTTIGEH